MSGHSDLWPVINGTHSEVHAAISEVSDLPDDKRFNERDCQQEGELQKKGFHLFYLFSLPVS